MARPFGRHPDLVPRLPVSRPAVGDCCQRRGDAEDVCLGLGRLAFVRRVIVPVGPNRWWRVDQGREGGQQVENLVFGDGWQIRGGRVAQLRLPESVPLLTDGPRGDELLPAP